MKRSYHEVKVEHDIFTVDTRYTQLLRIGQGAYGNVASALDGATGTRVAIKKIKNPFSNVVLARRILREIKLLLHFNAHENVVTVHDIMSIPEGREDFDEVYIVCDLMEGDLDQILGSPQELSERHHQYFLYQLLKGMKYVHSANVIHRDLKPQNILLNSNCDLALCDFGLSRGVSGEVDDGLTEYVVTRWYRAPELLCDASTYGKSVDVWGIGCIFAEMLCRKPIFQGRTPINQLQMILDVLGCPPVEELGFVPHEGAERMIRSANLVTPKGLQGLLPKDVSDDAFDLLSKMLVIKPEDRITVDDALKHPYLKELHSDANEPACESVFDNTFEIDTENTKEGLQRIMFAEVLKIQPK